MTKIELRYSEENGYYALMYRDDKLIKKAIGDDFTYNIEKLSSFDKILKNADISNDVFKAELYDGVIEFYNLEKYDELLTKYFPKSYTYAKNKLAVKQKKEDTAKNKALAKEDKENERILKQKAASEAEEIRAKEITRKKLIKDYEASNKKALKEENQKQSDLEDAIKRNQKEKKAELRLRKIEKVNRAATIAGTVIVWASLIASVYFLGYKEVISKINRYAENNKHQTEVVMINEEEPKSDIDDVIIHSIDIPITTSEEKSNAYLLAEEKYKDIISELSENYGIDASLLTAICASNINDKGELVNSGGRIGPMNISNYELEGRVFRVYNYKQKTWDTIVVKQEKLKNDYQNIRIGCAILQMAYRDANGNLVAALESSGLGKYSFNKLKDKLINYTSNTTLNYDNILANKDSYAWFNAIFSDADSTYFGKVASYLPPNQIISMRLIKFSGAMSTDFYTIEKPIEKELENTY